MTIDATQGKAGKLVTFFRHRYTTVQLTVLCIASSETKLS